MTPKLHLRAWRKRRGLSAAELAKRCGLTGTTLTRYETGEISPTFDTVARIAQALEVGIEQLLGTPPEPPTKPKRRRGRP